MIRISKWPLIHDKLYGLGGDRRLALGAERLRSPPRGACQPRRRPIARRRHAASLRSVAAGILQKLKKAEGSSAESIAALAKVDSIKQRMEAAYETLQDAAGLTQLSSTVEDAFASGDLPRAAETLANMRHCLSAVGKVTEFAYVRKQLEVLEDRLDSMASPGILDQQTTLLQRQLAS
nr:conserved oligomeric golgi complex subunit 7 [Quercus suber]